MDEAIVKKRNNTQFILLIFLGLLIIFVIGRMVEPEILSTIITSIFSLLYIIVLSYFWLGKPRLSGRPKSKAEMNSSMIEVYRLERKRIIEPKFEDNEKIIYDKTLCIQTSTNALIKNSMVVDLILTDKRIIIGQKSDEFNREEKFDFSFQKTPENRKKMDYGKDEDGEYIVIPRAAAISRVYHPKSKEIYEFFTKI